MTRADALFRLIWAVPLAVLYVGFPAENYTEAEDALYYIRHVTEGELDWHPNHLLFEPVSWLTYKIAQALGYASTAAWPMKLLNSVAAMIALEAVFRLIRQCTGGIAAAIATLAVGVGFGFWHYATQAETYLLPLAFALPALVLLSRERLSGLGIGGLMSAAVLMHQMYAFLAILAAVPILMADLKQRSLRQIALYALTGIVVTGAGYLLAFAIVAPDQAFLVWVRGHAAGGLWDPPSIATPVKALFGLTIALMSPNALFHYAVFSDLLASLAPGKLLIEEQFLAAREITGLEAAIVVAAFCVMGAAAVTILVFGVRPREPWPRLDRLLLGAIPSYILLISIWEPLNREFWITVVVLLILLLARRTNWQTRWARIAWPAFAGALVVGNFIGAIEPYSKESSDYWRAINAPLLVADRAGDVVITECGYICANLLMLDSPADIIVPSYSDPEQIAGVLQSGRRVILTGFALDPGAEILRQSPEGAWQNYMARLAAIVPLPAHRRADFPQVFYVLEDGSWSGPRAAP